MPQVELLRVRHASPVAAIPTAQGAARLAAGLLEGLTSAGVDVELSDVDLPEDRVPGAVAADFALAGALAIRVRAVVEEGRLPVVLSGSCHAGLAGVAGLPPGRRGVAWLDAHGDFNTPETTGSGLLDGTTVASITGRCWAALCGGVPGFAAVDDDAVVLLGVRELDAGEAALLDASGVHRLPPWSGEEPPVEALRALAGVASVYVHVDLDVLDAGVGRANAYAGSGGLSAAQLAGALIALGRGTPVRALGLASYDPAADTYGGAAAAAIQAVLAMVGAGERDLPTKRI